MSFGGWCALNSVRGRARFRPATRREGEGRRGLYAWSRWASPSSRSRPAAPPSRRWPPDPVRSIRSTGPRAYAASSPHSGSTSRGEQPGRVGAGPIDPASRRPLRSWASRCRPGVSPRARVDVAIRTRVPAGGRARTRRIRATATTPEDIDQGGSGVPARRSAPITSPLAGEVARQGRRGSRPQHSPLAGEVARQGRRGSRPTLPSWC
jgi:hypothetical protein